jgi:hypothetical protein
VRTGTATALGGRPPSSTASRRALGSESFTTTDAVGNGMRRVDLNDRTSTAKAKRCSVSSDASPAAAEPGPSAASAEPATAAREARVGAAGAPKPPKLERADAGPRGSAVEAAFSSSTREGSSRASAVASKDRSARAAERRGFRGASAEARTSRRAAKTRISGADVPLLPLNVGEESSIHSPALSPSGACRSAACFIVRMSTTTQPRRRLSSETAGGESGSVCGGGV